MYFIANLKLLKGRANSNGITFHKLTFALNLLSTRFAHIILEIKGITNAIKEKAILQTWQKELNILQKNH